MALKMGPVLSFRGCDPAAQQWSLTALVVADAAPGDLSVTGQAGTFKPEVLWKNEKLTAYRYTFTLPLGATSTYKVANKPYEVAVPAAGALPTMAYASCNGFSSLKLIKSLKDKEPNAVWTEIAQQHKKKPYHLLLLGGDQVYADSMWELEDSPMKAWAELKWDAGNAAAAPPAMRKWLDGFFFNLYTDRWSQPEVAAMLARIPTVAMWDDHDLTDGWGSYPVERQTSDVYTAIWKSASKAFAVFQQHILDGEVHPTSIGKTRPGAQLPVTDGAFSFGHVIGGIAILAIDMRSQRTEKTQVVSAAHWKQISDWIDALPSGVVHLLLMSSIPVVYPGFAALENVLGFIPGHQDLEDDLRDHWNSQPHQQERVRLIQRLLRIPRTTRPMILSGDVHVAALGVIESSRPQSEQHAINQLISSGIVHPGPGAIVLFGLRVLFDKDDEVERGVGALMIKFPNSSTKFVGNRNYLSLEPDADGRAKPRIFAHWHIEGGEFPMTKIVEPNPTS